MAEGGEGAIEVSEQTASEVYQTNHITSIDEKNSHDMDAVDFILQRSIRYSL